jgi:hypothetical protein
VSSQASRLPVPVLPVRESLVSGLVHTKLAIGKGSQQQWVLMIFIYRLGPLATSHFYQKTKVEMRLPASYKLSAHPVLGLAVSEETKCLTLVSRGVGALVVRRWRVRPGSSLSQG